MSKVEVTQLLAEVLNDSRAMCVYKPPW